MLNLPVQAPVNQTECLTNQYWSSKQERTKRKDQPWRRLATINKIAQKSGYNSPNYSEERNIAELLQQHGEYSYLTGKKLGTYYLSTLDIDIRKEKFAEKLVERLEKNITCLLDFLRVSYDKTKKGLHVDILTPKPLDNQQIYYRGWGKTWNIGSIQSLGKYVVGEDKDKAYINNGKWYWIVKSNEEAKAILNKFFFDLNNQEKEKATESSQLLVNETIKTIRYQAWNYNLNKQVEREYSLIVEEPQRKPQEPFKLPTTQLKYTTIHAKILSKWKTNLEDMWKVLYLDQQGHKGYFLLNDYHRKNFNLNIGETRSMLLVNGQKHSFFSRLL